MDVKLPSSDIHAALTHPLVQGLLEGCSDGAVVIDARSRKVLAMNVRARSLLGYGDKDISGCACKVLLKSSICATACPLPAGADGREPGTEQDLFYRGVGDRVLHAAARMIILRGPDDEPLAGIELFRDVGDVRELERRLRERRSLHGIIGRSRAMQDLYDLIEQVAPYDVPALITGESGTGKERFADALQYLSERATKPYVKVNCAALSPSLVESELFGHKKGAFTGATQDRRGCFEEADGGTLLLDEVGELGPALQAKLLRVIQQGEVQRVGEDRTRHVNVRIIAATNRSVETEVAQGRFREDLYYRVAGVRLHIPPLRERSEDIPLLAEHFLERCATEATARGRPRTPPRLHESARDALMARPWRGNVRELENVLRLAFIRLPPGRDLLPADLLLPAAPGESQPGDDLNLATLERSAILRALDRSQNNLSAAARLLGIDRTTLWRKLRRGAILPEGLDEIS